MRIKLSLNSNCAKNIQRVYSFVSAGGGGVLKFVAETDELQLQLTIKTERNKWRAGRGSC